MAVTKVRVAELVATGLDPLAASTQAFTELREGKLKVQLKAWVDPILAHKRAMRLKNRNSDDQIQGWMDVIKRM
jgi:hypothetical protein